MVLWSDPTDPLTVQCLEAVVKTGPWSGALLHGARLDLLSESEVTSTVVRPDDTDPVVMPFPGSRGGTQGLTEP